MKLALWFVLDAGEKGLGVPGGGLGSRRKLWLGTSQSRTAKGPPLPPRICHSRKGAQAVAGGFWREQGLGGGGLCDSTNRKKT